MSTAEEAAALSQRAAGGGLSRSIEGGPLDPDAFRHDDALVRMFFWATMLWGVVGLLVGVILAFQLALPQLNLLPQISFGRLRPLP